MRRKDSEKICSHCEGRISVEADTCLYCGMPLVEEREEEKPVDVMSSLQGGIPSLYPPMYAKQEAKPEEAQEEVSEERANFLSILSALVGSTLLILGIMQGFFSDGDILRLEWNCHYWFLYVVLGLPWLYVSLKKRS